MPVPRKTPSLAAACGLILAAALALGLAFNLVMPQGVGWLPPWVSRPLWQPTGLPQAAALHRQGALFVDARDPSQYKTARVRGALSLYPSELKLIYPLLKDTLAKAPLVVVYGRSRSRFPAAQIGQFLRGQGLSRVYVLQEDFAAWQAAGLPVSTPRRRSGS